MINNIYGASGWIAVNGNPNSMPYINLSQPMAGMLRLNPSTNTIDVYNGSTWMSVSNDVSIDFSERVKQVLAWAEGKMIEEQKLRELMERHPGLKSLHDQLEMMKMLCTVEEENKQ